jgi:predicted DsbA family dithiol-disulfide isomerase
VIVYGDFSCPYSYLASMRVDALLEAGQSIEWRAVEHAPDLPVTGRRLSPPDQAELDEELQAVRALAVPGEELPRSAAAFLPNTQAAISAYAEAFGADVADNVRRLLFSALWIESRDIGNPEVLRSLLAETIKRGTSATFALHEAGFAVSTNRGPITVAAYHRIRDWRQGWESTGTHTTPTLVDDNVVLPGITALTRLAALLTDTAGASTAERQAPSHEGRPRTAA